MAVIAKTEDSLRSATLSAARCNLCGSQSFKIIYPKKHTKNRSHAPNYTITQDITSQSSDIVKCSDCGLVYLLSADGKDSLLDEYKNMQDELYLKEENGRRRAARRVLKDISVLKKPGRLLEIGPAAGFLLDEARGLGWEATGVEPSRWALRYARDNLGLNVIESSLEDAYLDKGCFDAVVIIDVLEHLSDPDSALRKIRQLLKDDGILYIATPDIESAASRVLKNKWWGIKRHHLYYFSRETLNALLDKAGYETIKTGSYFRYFSIGYLLRCLDRYNNVVANALKGAFGRASLEDKELLLDLHDQIAVYAKKKKILGDIIDSKDIKSDISRKIKTVIVLPAYNAASTLARTVSDIPDEIADDIILVDDASRDNTIDIAKGLGLNVFAHSSNLGYGANQKTCYENALKTGADIVVMLHPDYQYNPKVIPQLIEPIKKGKADAVFASRMMKGGALEGGMPKWKHNANILLTALENVVLGTYLSEYHSGFRAYSRKLLEAVNFKANSNGFIFDTEIIIQLLLKGFKIEEIPIKTRYFDEASTIGFAKSCLYGLGILKTLLKYTLHVNGIFSLKQFE